MSYPPGWSEGGKSQPPNLKVLRPAQDDNRNANAEAQAAADPSLLRSSG
jgi:hypothetical protein